MVQNQKRLVALAATFALTLGGALAAAPPPAAMAYTVGFSGFVGYKIESGAWSGHRLGSFDGSGSERLFCIDSKKNLGSIGSSKVKTDSVAGYVLGRWGDSKSDARAAAVSVIVKDRLDPTAHAGTSLMHALPSSQEKAVKDLVDEMLAAASKYGGQGGGYKGYLKSRVGDSRSFGWVDAGLTDNNGDFIPDEKLTIKLTGGTFADNGQAVITVTSLDKGANQLKVVPSPGSTAVLARLSTVADLYPSTYKMYPSTSGDQDFAAQVTKMEDALQPPDARLAFSAPGTPSLVSLASDQAGAQVTKAGSLISDTLMVTGLVTSPTITRSGSLTLRGPVPPVTPGVCTGIPASSWAAAAVISTWSFNPSADGTFPGLGAYVADGKDCVSYSAHLEGRYADGTLAYSVDHNADGQDPAEWVFIDEPDSLSSAVVDKIVAPVQKMVTDIVTIGGRTEPQLALGATMYGPFQDKPVQADTVPADAPKVGDTDPLVTDVTNGAARREVSMAAPTKPGWYAFVEWTDVPGQETRPVIDPVTGEQVKVCQPKTETVKVPKVDPVTGQVVTEKKTQPVLDPITGEPVTVTTPVWDEGPDGILDEAHGGAAGDVSTDDVEVWEEGPDGIFDEAHGGQPGDVSTDDVQKVDTKPVTEEVDVPVLEDQTRVVTDPVTGEPVMDESTCVGQTETVPTVNRQTAKFGVESEMFYVAPAPTLATQINQQLSIVGDKIFDKVKVTGVEEVLKASPNATATLTGQILAADAIDGKCDTVDWKSANLVNEFTVKVDKDGELHVGDFTVKSTKCYTFAEQLLVVNGSTVISNTTSEPGLPEETTLVKPPKMSTQTSFQLAGKGAQVTDKILVEDLNSPADIKAVLFGPKIPEANKDCSSISEQDWRDAIASGAVGRLGEQTLHVEGAGAYETDPVSLDRPGCGTWVETMTSTDEDGTEHLLSTTPPGLKEETTLVVDPLIETTKIVTDDHAGASIGDKVTLSVTFGQSGNAHGQLLYAPSIDGVCPVEGSSAWDSAEVVGETDIAFAGDGDYESELIATDPTKPGCTTWTWKATIDTQSGPVTIVDAPGKEAETQLLQAAAGGQKVATPKPPRLELEPGVPGDGSGMSVAAMLGLLSVAGGFLSRLLAG